MQSRLSMVKFPVHSSMLGVSDDVVHLKRSSSVKLQRQIAHERVFYHVHSVKNRGKNSCDLVPLVLRAGIRSTVNWDAKNRNCTELRISERSERAV